MSQDFYDMLGVPRDATQAQIKRAYRRRALDLHPDRQGGRSDGGEAFRRLTKAYEVLGDPSTRRRYDRKGHAGVGSLFAGLREVDPSDMLRRFGRVLRRVVRRTAESRPSPPDAGSAGRDVYTEREIAFRKASLGGRVRIETIDGPVTMTIPPGTCSGTRFRLEGRGYGRGHHFVDVVVQTPAACTERQRERARASAAGAEVDADGSLLGRLRDVVSRLRPGGR